MTEQLPLTVDLGPVDLAPTRARLAGSPFAPPELGPAAPAALRFTVLGRPQPAGSKRAFAIRRGGVPTGRVAVVDDNAKGKPWRADVLAAAVEALERAGFGLLTGPLELTVVFVLARPAGHYGTGRNAGCLKPSAAPWPTTRPDATKLLRALEDALTGVVWRDDAQIVVQTARKVYGAPTRCEVEVRSLDPIGSAVREAAR